MRSVGIPELESESIDITSPAVSNAPDNGPKVALVGVLVVGLLLWFALGAIGPTESDGDPQETPVGQELSTPSTTAAPLASATPTTATPMTDLVAGPNIASPRPSIEGARVLREAVPEWPVVSSETGFVKIGTEGGQRTALISPNGLWWDSNLAVPMNGIDYGDPLVAVEVSPDWRHAVAIFRSPRGFLITRSTDNGVWLPPMTIEAPSGASVIDLVVGTEVSYVSVDSNATDPYGTDGSAFTIALDGDVDVRVLDPYPAFPDLVRLEAGTTLSDGTIAARGTTADGDNYLLHLLPDGDVSAGQFTGDTFTTARLFAHGSTLLIVDADGTTSLLRFDKTPTAPLEPTLDPQLTSSNGDILISIGDNGDETVLWAWYNESVTPTEIALGDGLSIDEIVAFNTNEVLLATTTPDGQRWLANVPLAGANG